MLKEGTADDQDTYDQAYAKGRREALEEVALSLYSLQEWTAHDAIRALIAKDTK